MSAWTYASTTDAPALAARLAAASNVILTTHTKPDHWHCGIPRPSS